MRLLPMPTPDQVATLLTGPRHETYHVDLLDEDENLIRVVTDWVDGSVEHNIDRVIHGGASFTLEDTERADWMVARFRPRIEVNGFSWPLGVYLATSPTEVNSRTGKRWQVGGLDKLIVLDEYHLPDTLQLTPNVRVTEFVTDLINMAGESAVAVTESTATLPSPVSWPPTTSLLRVINDALLAINYRAIWCDRWGQYRIEPYVRPGDRPVVWTFQPGQGVALHSADWERTQDITGVPNRVVLTTNGDDDNPGMKATAEDRDPDSPFSYERRGDRWVTRSYTGVEAADQDTLDALAQRYLANASSPIASFTFKHAPFPLEPLDACRVVTGGHNGLTRVNEYRLTLRSGEQQATLLDEVTL